MQHRSPLMTAHAGGRRLSDEQADAQWLAAWAAIASGCEDALKTLHRLHPRRGELMALARDARSAAGLPAEPQLRSA